MVITPDIFTILSLGTLGMLAGGIGALVGVGGGIFIVPALILFFGIDIKYAVAASLLAVVATSTAAGSVYVGRGLTNMRLGMTLEVSTTLGGIAGSFLVLWISQSLLLLCFSLLLSVVAFLTLRSKETARVAANEATPESPSTNLQVDNKVSVNAVATETTHKMRQGRFDGTYFDSHLKQAINYQTKWLPFGMIISFFAGIISGMLGVGGGFMKVPAMNLGMKVPIKAAAATSNFMIGVTAASSLYVYFAHNLIQPMIAAPLVCGAVVGTFLATRASHLVSAAALKKVLSVIMFFVSVTLFYQFVRGVFGF